MRGARGFELGGTLLAASVASYPICGCSLPPPWSLQIRFASTAAYSSGQRMSALRSFVQEFPKGMARPRVMRSPRMVHSRRLTINRPTLPSRWTRRGRMRSVQDGCMRSTWSSPACDEAARLASTSARQQCSGNTNRRRPPRSSPGSLPKQQALVRALPRVLSLSSSRDERRPLCALVLLQCQQVWKRAAAWRRRSPRRQRPRCRKMQQPFLHPARSGQVRPGRSGQALPGAARV